jgi:hypothetical protein
VIVKKPKISISEAIDYLNKVKVVLESSKDWNIDMDDDLENLKQALRKMRVSKQTSIFDFLRNEQLTEFLNFNDKFYDLNFIFIMV